MRHGSHIEAASQDGAAHGKTEVGGEVLGPNNQFTISLSTALPLVFSIFILPCPGLLFCSTNSYPCHSVD